VRPFLCIPGGCCEEKTGEIIEGRVERGGGKKREREKRTCVNKKRENMTKKKEREMGGGR
jgi:hypothetical protein